MRLTPQRATASRLPRSKIQLFGSFHSSETSYPTITKMVARNFVELKAYFISNCQGASRAMAWKRL
jgi:hypothetical protein